MATKKTNGRSGFRKGSGCYTCISCGKLTRNTHGCLTSPTCERCYDMAGDENAVTDGEMTVEEFNARWKPTPEETARTPWGKK